MRLLYGSRYKDNFEEKKKTTRKNIFELIAVLMDTICLRKMFEY